MCGSNFNDTDVTYIESCFIPVAFNSKPNFEGFKIHNFFMKIYEKWQNEFNIMLNVYKYLDLFKSFHSQCFEFN